MVNKVVLLGRVGKEPEIRTVNNAKVASFSLATSERYKDKNGEQHENTEWHNIVVWRGLADVAERFIHKGTLLFVEGKIRYRSWADGDSGKKFYATDIIADNFQMVGGKADASANAPAPAKEEDDESVDLPF